MEKEMADLEKIEKTAGERSAMLARDESLQRKSLEEFSGLQARLRSFEDECAEASKEAGKERQTKTEMEDAREKIRENAKKIESLANVLNAHRNLLAETEAAESLERSVARQEESRAKAELRLSEMERAPGARDGEFEMLEPWERALREELYGTKSALQGAKSREEAARKELDLLKGMIKKAGDAAELARKTNEKVTKAKLLQNALVEVQEGLRAQLVSAVNESLAASWGEVYPYRDYSSARLKPAADDYELQLQEGGGEWVGADHASGGEKSIAALCLRMAFARVLAPSLGLLILDEPTHNLDEAGTAALSEALRRGAGEGGAFEQIFIITHDDALREAAEGALYSFERGKTGVAGDATAAVDLSERENG
jgi:DNA repair exonuclease SbcCD ATPase subunit